jgi:hypothetical protein
MKLCIPWNSPGTFDLPLGRLIYPQPPLPLPSSPSLVFLKDWHSIKRSFSVVLTSRNNLLSFESLYGPSGMVFVAFRPFNSSPRPPYPLWFATKDCHMFKRLFNIVLISRNSLLPLNPFYGPSSIVFVASPAV